MKRSSKYDVFQGGPRNNKPEYKSFKDKMKLFWKFARIGIYASLAGLSLTGCIQSFVLQSSSTVGSGIELYSKEGTIAPYVNSYKIETKTREVFKKDTNGNYILDENGQYVKEQESYHVIIPLLKENFLASDETIVELRNSLADFKSKYGAYDNRSSSLRIIGTDGKEIADTTSGSISGSDIEGQLVKNKTENRYLFMNNFILDELNANGQVYNPINDWSDVSFFALKRPDDLSNLSDSQKELYGKGVTSLNSAFKPFEVVKSDGTALTTPSMVEVQNGQYVTYDSNWDGINDSNSLVVIKDEKRINAFKYSFEAEIVSVKKSTDNLFNSELYARDFFQSMANVNIMFAQVNPILDLVKNKANQPSSTTSNPNERFNLLSSTNLEKLMVDPNSASLASTKLLSASERDAILAYQNEIVGLTKNMNFGIKKQIYTNDDNEDSATFSTPYQVEFMPELKNKKGKLIGAAPVSQKPISSWGESWSLGPFYGLVVWPIAWIIDSMVGSMPPMDGWAAIISIVVAVIATRMLTTLLSYKSAFSQHKQSALAPKKAKIDAKYEGFKGNKQMEAKKRQEISDLYKKNGVSMSGPMLSMLITMPIFLAVWRVVQGIPDIKSASWLGIQFSLVSWKELFAGEWQYLPLLIVAIIVQAGSQLLPRLLNKKRMKERSNVAEKAALKKADKTQNIMMIVFVFMAVIFEAGVQIYWIVGGLWQISQTLIIHWLVKTEFYKTKLSKYV